MPSLRKLLVWGIPTIALLGLVGWRFSVRGQEASQMKGAGPGAAGGGAGGRGGTGGRPGGGGPGGGGGGAIEVTTATVRTIESGLQSVGNVESPFKVEVSPRSSGRIEMISLREGDTVRPGQILLKIDPSDLFGAVAQAQANLAEARSRVAQAKITQGSTDVGISSQIKQQKAAVASAEADLNQLQRNYDAQVAQAQSQVDSANSGVNNASNSLGKEKASLQNAQVKYDRTYNLYKQGFIAAQDVDDARTALDVQKGAVAVAQGQLEAANSQWKIQQQNLSIVKRKSQADIASSQAKLTQAKANLAVAMANRAQSPAYKENIAALQSAVSAVQAQLAQAQARLNDTTVKSPIKGTVTARKADPGDLAGPGSPVMEIQFLDWLYVTTSLPVEQSATIHEGQLATVSFDSLPGKTFSGPIEHLNLAADPASRQFSVRIRVNNADHALRPGMYARINIVTQRIERAITVPREAITLNPSGDSTVAVVDADSVAHVRSVKLGANDDKGYQVLSGVQAGDKVVVLSSSPVRDGQKVMIARPGEGGAGGAGGNRRGRRGTGRPGAGQ